MREAEGGWYRRALMRWVGAVHVRAPLVALTALLLTVAAAAYALSTLTINARTTDMISPEVPFRRNDTAFKQAFPQFRDLILIVIDGATPEQNDEAAERLAERLAAERARFHSIYAPGEDPFFRRNGLLFLGAEDLSRLADRLAAAEPLLATLAEDPTLRGFADVLVKALDREDAGEAADLETLMDRTAAAADAERAGRPLNLSWQALLAERESAWSAKKRLILAQPVLDYRSLRPGASALAEIRRIAAELGIAPENGLRLRLTGPVALDQEEIESAALGSKTASLVSFLLVSLLLVAGLRSVSLIIATAATLVMGLIWTAAFAALSVGQLNLISVAFAVLFIGLGVDFGIHMSLRYREEAAAGAGQREALLRAAGGVGGGLSLSALSAAVGFYAFLPTDYRGLAELGLIAGTGMFIALIANLTVLPALLALFPPGSPPARFAGKTSFLARLVRQRRRAILGSALLLGAAGAAAAPFARFDFNPLNLKDPAAESVTTFLDLANEPSTSPYVIEVLADGLEAANALASRLAALPEVGRALTLSDFLPREQGTKLRIIDDMSIFLTPVLSLPAQASPPDAEARRAAFGRLRERLASAAGGPLSAPAARLAAALDRLAGGTGASDAALASLERRLTAHLPRMFERLRAALAARPVALADLPPGLRSRWLAKDGRARIEVHPSEGITDNRELRRFAEAVLAVAPTATGTPVVIAEAGKAVVAAFRKAAALAFLLIGAALLIAMRRLSDIFLVLAPLALAAVLTVAASVLLGLPFNFANVIALPLLMGLGVSSGIHLVLRLREEGDPARVLASSTSPAVLFSALTTIAAFGSLAFSGHRGMTSMGQLLTIAITMTLAAMLIVLPSLMRESAGARDGEKGP